MNNFFKTLFASCLGTLLALMAIVGIFALIGAALGGDSKTETKSSSVLELSMPALIPERTNNVETSPFEFNQDNIWGIHDYAYAIENAATDSKIKAMVLRNSGGSGFVHLDIMRRAINTFKASGKPVYAYGDYYSQADYYLSSSADKIFLQPLGTAELKGFAIQTPFVKDFLAKFGVEMEIYYAGNFKSATEPFRRNDMSEQNKLQLKEFIGEVYESFLDSISVSRNIPKDRLKEIANGYLSRDAQSAVDLQLVDQIGYETDMYSDLKNTLDLDKDAKLNQIGLQAYRASITKKRNIKANDKVAVIYAEGQIVETEKTPGTITSDEFIPLIRKIRRDKKVKAIVLRVNSGGGNALTSDKILEEIRLAKADGIKVVTSMSDYAASGGYYIACESDTIMADPNTITGSIGVFIMFPNISKTLNEKMSVYMDSVRTAKFAGGFNIMMPRSQEEKVILQEMTESMYDKFLSVVSQGRGMSKEAVHEVAQGRIWTGTKAKELGLVDVLGGLDDAIKLAAEMAGTDNYRVAEYPESKKTLDRLMDKIQGKSGSDNYIQGQIEDAIPTLKEINIAIKKPQPRMALPFEINMK